MKSRKAIIVVAASLSGALGLATLLLATTDAPPNRCIVCGEPIKSQHSMLYFVFYGHERAFHLVCISANFRDHAESRMRALAKERSKEIDTSGRHPDDPLSQAGPGHIVDTVDRDIANYEKTHPRQRSAGTRSTSLPAVEVPKESVERAEQEEARKGK
jgi:hypothetical protein